MARRRDNATGKSGRYQDSWFEAQRRHHLAKRGLAETARRWQAQDAVSSGDALIEQPSKIRRPLSSNDN